MMYLDPQTKIDMSLDDIIYHEKQHQRYIERLIQGRSLRQYNNGYLGNGTWNRNMPYRRNPNWRYNYRNSLNRVKRFYEGQRNPSYRSRYQNWNRVKNWTSQQQQQNHPHYYGQDEQAGVQEYEDYDYGISDCLSMISTISKSSRRRQNRRLRRASSSLNTSVHSMPRSEGFKRPEIPYSSPRLNNLTNLVIKINNVPKQRKFVNKMGTGGGLRGPPLTLNERFSL